MSLICIPSYACRKVFFAPYTSITTNILFFDNEEIRGGVVLLYGHA